MKILVIIILSISLLFSAVDINNANKKELMSLNGIGPKKADAILKYRKETCFKNVNGLQKVKGVGPKTMEKNIKNIKVGRCNSNKK